VTQAHGFPFQRTFGEGEAGPSAGTPGPGGNPFWRSFDEPGETQTHAPEAWQIFRRRPGASKPGEGGNGAAGSTGRDETGTIPVDTGALPANGGQGEAGSGEEEGLSLADVELDFANMDMDNPLPPLTGDEAEASPIEEEARQAAYNDGWAAGYEQAQSEAHQAADQAAQARVADALEAIAESLPDARQELDTVLSRAERRSTRLVLAIIRRLAPELEDGVARERALAIVREAIQAARGAPELTVVVSPEMHEELSGHLDALKSAGDDKVDIHVRVDKQAGPGAVRVLWETGGVEYDVHGASREIEALISRAEEAAARSVQMES
jgi:flagellar assembly protein FliH